jgi:DNA or RNA helicases of superfamily II
MWLPLERLQAPKDILRRLTVRKEDMGAEEPTIIQAYSHVPNNYLEVPRQIGLTICDEQGIEVDDQTVAGVPVTFPRMPALRDYQVEGHDAILAEANNSYDFLFRARTAYGKTAVLLHIAAIRGVSTLVLVDQENLKDQWIDTLTRLYGFARDDIGMIQGKVCDYQGKAVTIAMVQTLARGRHDHTEALGSFGMLIVDECHVIASTTFQMVLFDIPATLRIGISATPKRRDGTQALLTGHLGEVKVAADAEHAKSVVYVVKSYGTYSWYANVSSKVGRFITEVAEDAARNLLFMEVVQWLYQTGRDVLILSDRIEQLRHLLDLAYYMGIPEADLGLYTGRDPHYGITKDPLPETDLPGASMTPQRLQLISRTIPKRQLEQVKATARVLAATYGMFAKGVDVPRLSGGVDATPRSSAEQVHGRILRGASAKTPVWVTVVDWNSYRSIHGSIQRLKDYVKSNAEIHEWLDTGGSTPWPLASYVASAKARIRQLKDMEIQSCQDGRHRLVAMDAATRLKRLQQSSAQHDRLSKRKHGQAARSPISASDRPTRSMKTTGSTASAPHATPTAATTPHRRVPLPRAGSRRLAPFAK